MSYIQLDWNGLSSTAVTNGFLQINSNTTGYGSLQYTPTTTSATINVPIYWNDFSQNVQVAPNFQNEVERVQAKERALKALEQILENDQWEWFKEKHEIVVASKKFEERQYRIKTGTVDVEEAGKKKGWLCIHPLDPEVVNEDNVIANYLGLECDEERLLAVANFHPEN